MAYSRLLLEVLAARGISDPEGFLAPPTWLDVEPPKMTHGTGSAVAQILAARDRGHTVAVFGDRDCDGVCATAIIVSTLSALGLNPLVHIPHRDEGYGLSREAVHRFGQAGIRLLICVDNGINAGEELYLARKLGMDTLVIDHHRKGRNQASCPAVWDSKHSASTLAMLTSWAVLDAAGVRAVDAWRRSLNRLAAIASVTDHIPMIGQARLLARLGLRDLAHVSNGGLQSLLRTAGVKDMATSTQIQDFVGPILTAPGLIRSPMFALNMLIEKNRSLAIERAMNLIAINRERQEMERKCLAEFSSASPHDPFIQVIASDSWPRGIIGAVAERSVDRFGTPCIVLAPSAVPDLYAGSGRSVLGFSLVEALDHCSDLLDQHGGHPMAVGLRIRKGSIDEFRSRIQQYAKDHPSALLDTTEPEGELALSEHDSEFKHTLLAMEPFGEQMRPPRLLIRGLTVQSKTPTTALLLDAHNNRLSAFTRPKDLQVGQKLDAVCEIKYDSATLVSVYSKSA